MNFGLTKKFPWSCTLPIFQIWPRVIFFLFFPRLKSALKQQRFRDVEEFKVNTATELKALISEQFQKIFEKWQHRWNHCISSGGEYCEGDNFK